MDPFTEAADPPTLHQFTVRNTARTGVHLQQSMDQTEDSPRTYKYAIIARKGEKEEKGGRIREQNRKKTFKNGFEFSCFNNFDNEKEDEHKLNGLLAIRI